MVTEISKAGKNKYEYTCKHNKCKKYTLYSKTELSELFKKIKKSSLFYMKETSLKQTMQNNYFKIRSL